ncbi:hypothetical protein [Streptomyces sp. NPDC056982]|uniref:hypothetical protein n=1 Tax=Streptomyces sp. NPDC056982 TaxID=3345986 RepID=UPI00363EF59A
MGGAVAGEAEPEDGVDAFLFDDGHEVVEIADLLVLVAHQVRLGVTPSGSMAMYQPEPP